MVGDGKKDRKSGGLGGLCVEKMSRGDHGRVRRMLQRVNGGCCELIAMQPINRRGHSVR
jgi:hypothetical protein